MMVARRAKRASATADVSQRAGSGMDDARAWALIERARDRNAAIDPDTVLDDVGLEVEAVRKERHEREGRRAKSSR